MIEGLPPEIKRLYEKWEKDKSSRIFAALANGLRKMGFYDEALNVVNEGLLRNPDYPEGYLVLGRINLDKGNTQAAIEAFKRVVSLDPYNAVAVRFLAECFESQGNLREALEYYKKLKDLDPFFEEVDKKIENIEKKIKIPKTEAEEISVLEEKPVSEEIVFELEREEKEEEEKGEIILDEFKIEEIPPFLKEEEVGKSILDELDKVKEEVEERMEKEIVIPELESARIFEEQGFLEKALENYKKVIEKYPDKEEIREKIKELEEKIKPELEIPEREEKEEEEIVPPEIPEEAIKVFEEIEELPAIEEIFGKEKEKKEEELPTVEEIVEEEKVKYSPHPFKIAEPVKEEKEKLSEVEEEIVEYIPFYEKEEEIKEEEIEKLLIKMHEEKKREEEKRKEMEEKIKEEEKIKDEENYRTFLEWIEKLKK